ncbi:MAG: FeoB-associated Cys-rich membrane protein [Clostridia bacterium]
MNSITWFILLLIIISTVWIIIKAYKNAQRGKCTGCSQCEQCWQAGNCPTEQMVKKLEENVVMEEHNED